MPSKEFLAASEPAAWVRLLFKPKRARSLAGEVWHPRQESQVDPDGSYELSFPYSDDPQLLDDILSFGPDVRVLAPQNLRLQVQQRLLDAIAQYREGDDPGMIP